MAAAPSRSPSSARRRAVSSGGVSSSEDVKRAPSATIAPSLTTSGDHVCTLAPVGMTGTPFGAVRRLAADGADEHGLTGTERPGPGPLGGGPGRWVRLGQSSYASSGGQEQTRLRSPYAWSMRRTGTQYLSSRSEG